MTREPGRLLAMDPCRSTRRTCICAWSRGCSRCSASRPESTFQAALRWLGALVHCGGPSRRDERKATQPALVTVVDSVRRASAVRTRPTNSGGSRIGPGAGFMRTGGARWSGLLGVAAIRPCLQSRPFLRPLDRPPARGLVIGDVRRREVERHVKMVGQRPAGLGGANTGTRAAGAVVDGRQVPLPL